MSFDIDRATSFMTGHARLLDRHRFARFTGDATAGASVLAALDGYRNPDGGFGWGLEPDLRAPESQPAGALHALEAIADAAIPTTRTRELLDWLESVTLPDGGLPFALPIADPTACAPFWAAADPAESSLQITAAVAAQAHRAAHNGQDIAGHPWLATGTEYCLEAIEGITEPPFAYVLSFTLRFLDVLSRHDSRALPLIDRLAEFVPADGAVPVAGGAEGETLRLLDIAPEPDGPVRALFDRHAVESDLDRVEHGQRPDGGWDVDFTGYSPAARLEWRGYVTVGSVVMLRANGRTSLGAV